MRRVVLLLIGLGSASLALAEAPGMGPATGQAQEMQVYLGGFSYWDTAPQGVVEISHPVRHRYAGGMGTFSNPITMAVGIEIIDGETLLDFPPGTIFYLPRLRKYAVVEDSCGPGASLQEGLCHPGYRGLPMLQIYLDGVSSSQAAAEACKQQVTGVQPVVVDPGPNMSVVVGPLTESGCFIFPDP